MAIIRLYFKCLLSLIILVAFSLSARAIPNPPRLAILFDPAFGQAGDLLSVELSQQTNIVLLERSEIERIIQEQRLALNGMNIKESIKAGHLLGADGLLTLNKIQTDTNSHLVATLIAVKQGVILDAMESPWPMKDLTGWVKLVRAHFQPFLPKLGVLPRDALPISVLNLRAAANSPDSKRTEKEMTELLLNRLTHERDLFILERRRLDQLSIEKELSKTEDSLFWNGSYLLEGTVDKNGFSKDVATISARLVPPGGGTAKEFEVSGRRSNPEEIIEQLAKRIMESLKKQSSASEWNPAAEAMQYYEEAKWALKWQLNREAQAAAESAWALGKHDMDCAMIRIQAHLMDITPDPRFKDGHIDPAIELTTLENIKNWDKPAGLVWDRAWDGSDRIRYLSVINTPAREQLDKSIHVMHLYHDFCLTLSPEEPKMNSAWYHLGVSSLTTASQVLQHFYLVRDSHKGVEEKLTELRSLARKVSEYILKSPSVRDVYWVGNRITTYDKLYELSEKTNIFQCKLLWGSFWQETPEDSVALYRDLMRSDVFCYIHKDFWFRALANPLLTAWKPEDSQRLPSVWNEFMHQLGSSTNLFLKLEYKSLQLARAGSPEQMETRFNDLISFIFDNRDAIVTNNVELLYLQWRIGDLVYGMGGSFSNPTKEKLQRQFYAEHRPRIEAMDQEYRSKMDERKRREENQILYDKQKEILKGDSYDFLVFSKAFHFFEYSPFQAAELEPLLTGYKSNLVAQAAQSTSPQQGRLRSGVAQVGMVEKRVSAILRPAAQNSTAKQGKPAPIAVRPTELRAPDMSAQAILMEQFFAIPVTQLPGEKPSEVRIFAHRIREGKLLLDLRYEERSDDATGSRAAVAIWNPKNGGWQVIPGEDPYSAFVGFMGENQRGLYFELFNGDLYLSDWKRMARYDSESRRWQKLDMLEQMLSQLFAIDGHLYAANDESIFEILDRGQGTRILASTRRRPAITALDLLPKLNSPTLFPGPDKTIRTCIENKVYTWDGKDWKESLNLAVNKRPEAFEEGTLLRSVPLRGEAQVWFLGNAVTNATLYWEEQVFEMYGGSLPLVRYYKANATNYSRPKSIWKPDAPLQIAGAPGVATATNLHFFLEDCVITNTANNWSVIEKNGHHAFLVCLESGFQKPLIVPLRFDLTRGPMPSENLGRNQGRWQFGSPWMVHVADYVIIGHPGMAGLWALPRAQLEAAISREKKLGHQRDAEKIAKAERMQKELLAQYDLNHDDTLNPNEKEEAVKDLRWLEVNWHLVDANKNGFLDPEDNLAVFDANENGQAEDSEAMAIDQIQALIAAELIRRWDQDRDGALSEQELKPIVLEEDHEQATARSYFNVMYWPNSDANHDRKLDQKELEGMLTSLTRLAILQTEPPGSRGMPAYITGWKHPAAQEAFKRIIESLWKQYSRRMEGIKRTG